MNLAHNLIILALDVFYVHFVADLLNTLSINRVGSEIRYVCAEEIYLLGERASCEKRLSY
jgi:hypothetical protein